MRISPPGRVLPGQHQSSIRVTPGFLRTYLGRDMSEKEAGRVEGGKAAEKGFRTPGLRGATTTTLFRAVNPELFVKPNKPMMAFGLVSITLCVGYLGYLHAMKDNDQQMYEAVDSHGERYTRRKTSKWE